MKYSQRDIVEVNFLFPDGTLKVHPAIIISNDVLQEDEFGLVYLVLITSNLDLNPQYSYPLITARGDKATLIFTKSVWQAITVSMSL